MISAIEAAGWYHVAQKGSHVQFKHPTKPGKATVPHPKKDLPPGTLKASSDRRGETPLTAPKQ